jgi:hypothetical protein
MLGVGDGIFGVEDETLSEGKETLGVTDGTPDGGRVVEKAALIGGIAALAPPETTTFLRRDFSRNFEHWHPKKNILAAIILPDRGAVPKRRCGDNPNAAEYSKDRQEGTHAAITSGLLGH